MENIFQWIQHESECPKEANERQDARVEQRLFRQHVGKLGVKEHESNSHGQIHPGFQKRDDLGTASFGGDHQNILGVSEDCVVEEDTEEHQSEGDDFFESSLVNAEDFPGFKGRGGRGGEARGVCRRSSCAGDEESCIFSNFFVKGKGGSRQSSAIAKAQGRGGEIMEMEMKRV